MKKYYQPKPNTSLRSKATLYFYYFQKSAPDGMETGVIHWSGN